MDCMHVFSELLERMGLHNDLIFVYKILNGIIHLNIRNDFNTIHSAQMCRRSSSFKLVKSILISI